MSRSKKKYLQLYGQRVPELNLVVASGACQRCKVQPFFLTAIHGHGRQNRRFDTWKFGVRSRKASQLDVRQKQ